MSSLTKSLPQLYEEEQDRTKMLQKKITRLEHDLDVTRKALNVAKDFEDWFEVQTERLSMKDAALLELQTTLDCERSQHDEELSMLRRHLEKLLAVSRISTEAQHTAFEVWHHGDPRDTLEQSWELSMSALNKVENTATLIERSLKLYRGDERKADMVQRSKPSNVPGNTLRAPPQTQGVQSAGKPYVIPQRREMPIRPIIKRDTLEATKTPARNQPMMDDGFTVPPKGRTASATQELSQGSLEMKAASVNRYAALASTEKRAPKATAEAENATGGVPLPKSLQVANQDAPKREPARSGGSPALTQTAPPAPTSAPAPTPAPTPAPKYQNKVQDEGSQLRPRLATNTNASKRSTSSLNPGAIALTPKTTKSMAEVAAPLPTKQQAGWSHWKRVIAESHNVEPVIRSKTPDQKKMKDATAGKVVPPGKPKPKPEPEPESEPDHQKSLFFGSELESESEPEPASENSKLAEIHAKGFEEEGWARPTDPSTMQSLSKVDARKGKTRRSAAKAKAKLTPAEREMLRLKDRQSLHISRTGY